VGFEGRHVCDFLAFGALFIKLAGQVAQLEGDFSTAGKRDDGGVWRRRGDDIVFIRDIQVFFFIGVQSLFLKGRGGGKVYERMQIVELRDI
jgi:hypothetical protein